MVKAGLSRLNEGMAKDTSTGLADQVEGITSGVVVGHDGSDSADRALTFGAEEARLRGVELHLVRAWSITTVPRPAGVPHGVVASAEEYTASVQAELEATALRVLGPDHSARIHVVHGAAAASLIAASKFADVMVVASRGLGGFVGLLVGSTSEQVVRHADCPVVVVRG